VRLAYCILALLTALTLAACAPSAASIGTAIAQTQAASPVTSAASGFADPAAAAFKSAFCQSDSQGDCAHLQIMERVVWDAETVCIHIQVAGQDKDMVGVMRNDPAKGWNDVAAYSYISCAGAHVQFYGQ
jgi:hypothetical protein